MKKSAKAGFVYKSALILVASAALAACSGGSGDPLLDATAAIERQDYRAARIHLKTALRENSSDAQANYLFAKTLVELGDGEAATAALKKLENNSEYQERIQPLLGRAQILLGAPDKALALAADPKGKFADQLFAIKSLALSGLNRAEEAATVLAEGLATNPDSAELQRIDSYIKLQAGNIDGAAKSSKRSLELAPDSAEAFVLAGRVLMAKSRANDALVYFTKAREARPDMIEPEFLRGGVMKNLGDRSGARQSFETVLSKSPNHPWATYFIAEMDHQDGKSSIAFDRLQASKANLTIVPPASRLQGILEVQRGAYEQAIDKLRRYLAQNPADAQSVMALAQAYAKAGNEAEAFRVILPLVKTATAPVDALKLATELAGKVQNPIATSLAQRVAALEKDPQLNRIFEAENAITGQEWTRAETIYAELLAANAPRKLMLLNNAAMVQLNLGKADEAIAFARQAHKLAPEDPIVMDTLGWTLLQTRTDIKTALELLQQAATAAPDNGEIHWHLANALAANGKTQEARQLVSRLATNAEDGDKALLASLLARI